VVGRIHLLVCRWGRQILWQVTLRCIDGLLNITGCAVDIARQIELERDGSRSQDTGRGYLVDAREVGELPFERLGDGAPGRLAETEIVGKSTVGIAATGNRL
jgi:hypothetical protein